MSVRPIEFAFPGPLRDRLLSAIERGEKTSTSSLLCEYESTGDPLPRVGDRGPVVDSRGGHPFDIEVTEVAIVRLADVSRAHAVAEGEGLVLILSTGGGVRPAPVAGRVPYSRRRRASASAGGANGWEWLCRGMSLSEGLPG